MPVTDVFRLGPDGKVIPGVTCLRDPQTGIFEVVDKVWRSEDARSSPYFKRGATNDEINALNGGARTHGSGGAK